MKPSNFKFIIFSFSLLVLLGCSKYSDGPGFSFISAKSRMVNHWELVEATGNNQVITSFYPLKEMVLEESFLQTSTFRTLNVPTILDGSWEFTSEKENLKLSFTNESFEFRIQRLTKDELKMNYLSNDTTYVLTYNTY